MGKTKNLDVAGCNVFIGIDQSLNSTGYYIKHACGYSVGGLIKPRKNIVGRERLELIYKGITAILKHHKGSSTLVCMEGYAYNYRKGKVFELGEVGGIVKLCCQLHGVRGVVSIPPSDLKKFVTGSGSASKERMMKTLDETQDDIADAKGLMLIAEEMVKSKSTTRSQLEVIRNCFSNY